MLRRLASMQFREGESVAIIEPVGSPLFPAIAVAIRREGWRVLRRKIDIFGDALQFRVHQRFLVMFLGDEHVKRRYDEQRENCSNSHAADEHETN